MNKLKLNLGCASNILDGYINIDQDDINIIRARYPWIKFPQDAFIYTYDVFNLPYKDNTVDEIIADGFIEHLSFIEEKKMFEEIKRVLKPGGILSFAVPNFEKVVKLWLEAEDNWQDFYRLDEEAINQKHWFGTYTYEPKNRWGYLTAQLLLEGVGSGAVSNQVNDIEHSGLILVIGSNPTANHPVAATWMKNAAKNGTKIVLADPRVTDIGKHAWRTLQFKPDTDVAMLNAMIYTVIEEGLCDQHFIKERASNFEALKENVKGYSPEAMAPICGVPAATLREVAREFAKSKASMILWGMGVSQHVHGTDNARCLIALVSITGQIGKPGSGLHPLRGQNNVQGASDAGLIPMMFPNYQRVDNAQAHAWFEKFWNTPLDKKPGYTVVEIMHKITAPDSDPDKIRGMYIMGENPAMSDPDLNHARHALASLDHLVVQDIFMTETAWLADVILPASAWPEKTGTVTNTDRMVQLGKRALNPPGDAKPDLWIIQELAKRIGLQWGYQGEECGVAEVYDEMRRAMHAVINGITWDRLQRESCVTYPCLSEDDPGQPIVFDESFPTPDGKVKLVPADLIPANERPDTEYPFVLITGRQLEHWHTGSMTRRAGVLDAIEPMATASMCGEDMAKMGLNPGDVITVKSRRGEVGIHVRRDDGTPSGAVFMPFAYYEAAANLMTNPALDPFGKIPEFKYCAVAVQKGGKPAQHIGYDLTVNDAMLIQ